MAFKLTPVIMEMVMISTSDLEFTRHFYSHYLTSSLGRTAWQASHLPLLKKLGDQCSEKPNDLTKVTG